MIYYIGLVGQKGVGKTLTAAYFKYKYYTTTFEHIKEYTFADPIKKIATVFGFPPKLVYGTQNDKSTIYEPLGLSAREFLQKFGTEIGREIIPTILPSLVGKYNNVWINLLNLQIQADIQQTYLHDYLCKPYIVLISDVRFPDEAQYIKDNNGSLIKINRNTNYSEIHESEHKSERNANIIDVDFNIDNNGSTEFLYDQIDDIFAKLIFL